MKINNVNCIICSKKSKLIKRLKISEIFKNSSGRVPIEKLERFNIFKCKHCGLEFSYPMPSEEILKLYYKDYNDVRARKDVVLENARKNFQYLIKKYRLNKEHKLLDFGCGENLFVQIGNSPNWIGYDKYKSLEFPEGNYDFILLFGVLEHLINPLKEIRSLSKLLNHRGKICIITVGKTKTKIPYQYKVPEHVTFWNRKSINELFFRAGLKLKEFSPYRMYQDPEVFLDIIARIAKIELKTREMLYLHLPKRKKYIEIPTNEIFIIGEKI